VIAVDWVGIAAVITASGSAVAAVIAALFARSTHGQVTTSNDPRTIGQIVSDVAATVAPPAPPDHAG
jgi:hypothetical protein